MYLTFQKLLVLMLLKCAISEEINQDLSDSPIRDKSKYSKGINDFGDVLEKVMKLHVRRRYPKDCVEVQERGTNATGVYTIFPEFADEPFLVLCNMDVKGGGWAVFLNRFSGHQDFYLSWEDYKEGFGNLATEFWLGLEHLHDLAGYEVNELLVELVDWDSKKAYALYDSFAIGSENEDYVLKLLGGYSGSAGDSFSYHAGMKFTTRDKDKDNDRYRGGNCARSRNGAWWYNNCVNSHLTGKYLKGTSSDEDEFKVMYWDTFHDSKYSLKEARMMVRPRDTDD